MFVFYRPSHQDNHIFVRKPALVYPKRLTDESLDAVPLHRSFYTTLWRRNTEPRHSCLFFQREPLEYTDHPVVFGRKDPLVS
jgi:hypothetical protein